MKPNELRLLFQLAQNKGCKFITLTYRSASSGELARHTLLFGVDFKACLERDLVFLKRLLKSVNASTDNKLTFDAVTELIASMEKSLAKYDGDVVSKAEQEKDVYDIIAPGVKQHKDTGVYYIWALGHRKVVIEPGKPSKPVKSAPLTVEKDRIRAKLRSNQYRQFKLDNVGKAVVNGDTLTIE